MALFKRKTNKQSQRAQYAADNQRFIEDMSTNPLVTDLGGGVLMKTVEDGDPAGIKPQHDSVVTIEYTGRLINERIFDTTRGITPPAMRVSDLISGMQRALLSMRVGQSCQVFIPASEGYGNVSVTGIPASSTLIFDLKLLSVQ